MLNVKLNFPHYITQRSELNLELKYARIPFWNPRPFKFVREKVNIRRFFIFYELTLNILDLFISLVSTQLLKHNCHKVNACNKYDRQVHVNGSVRN